MTALLVLRRVGVGLRFHGVGDVRRAVSALLAGTRIVAAGCDPTAYAP